MDTQEPVFAALRVLSRALDRYRQAVGARWGLAAPDVVALVQLLCDEPMRAAAVGRATGLSPGSVTALLDRLEGRGYITRVRPPANRRTIDVRLTDAGRDLARAVVTPVEPVLRAASAAPGAPDPDSLAETLGRIAGSLDDLARGTSAQLFDDANV